MKNYISINDQKIQLTQEQVQQIIAAFGQLSSQPDSNVKLSDVAAGDTVRIGDHEMIVLEQMDGHTALIRKDILPEKIAFGSNNNYIGSNADNACEAFASEIACVVGAENMVLHDVDLTSDDGLDDFGKATGRRASLLTADMYRRYVRILDKHTVKAWWWLATPFSIPPHDEDNWVKCVSPSGCFGNCRYGFDCGVRPFCILKSTIFVSK